MENRLSLFSDALHGYFMELDRSNTMYIDSRTCKVAENVNGILKYPSIIELLTWGHLEQWS